MKPSSLLLSGVFALLLLAGCAGEPTDAGDGVDTVTTASPAGDAAAIQSELEGVVQQWENAFNAGDANALAELYTADSRLLPPGSGPVDGKDNIRSALDAMISADTTMQADLAITEVHPAGDLAIEEGRFTFTGADDSVLAEGKYVNVWKQEDGQWKIYRDIWNMNSPGPANQ